jgi:organic hydroperoxide reductase OsmC/OhrA
MSEHSATIEWQRRGSDFTYAEYSRDHTWTVADGVPIAASAAPPYLGTPGRIDPEDALVAAISSCHMLTFLAICARKRIIVDSYRDEATGFMERNTDGALAITRVELSPVIVFSDEPPDEKQLNDMHHLSHQECFIANSVRTDIQLTRLM